MSWFRSGLTAAIALLASPLAFAEDPIKITKAFVGLPSAGTSLRDDGGRAAPVAKNNAWAPVYVSLEIVKEITRDAALVIETTDTDDLTIRTFVPLQNLRGVEPGTRLAPAEQRFFPYVRPSGSGEVRITVCVPDKGSPDGWPAISNTYLIRDVQMRKTSTYVVLALGSNLRGFTLPNDNENANEDNKTHRGGRVEIATISNVAEMPDQWFGYDAADLVVLGTTNDKFITPLFTDPTYKSRLDALLEWVRRGGRLVVSVGRNAALASQFPLLQEFLPAAIRRDDPTTQVTSLLISWRLKSDNRLPLPALTGKNGAPFTMANVTPKTDRGYRLLVPLEGSKGPDVHPTVLQSVFGLGRITLTCIDLDNSPFVDYPAKGARDKFWDNMLGEAGAAKAASGNTARNINNNQYSQFGNTDAEDELATSLRNYIDHFDGVPVISFGWVAVFIVLYTLLIGPIEYFFLKKVLKRLELTWITFPIIVLTVSAIAYFTAYSIKGNDLKLNKMDIIDVDPASGRIYGRMWLTIFSPRPEKYTIGMTPNAGWADGPNESPTTGSLVDWYGGARTGSRSLLRRSYWYHIDPPGGVNRNPYDDGLVDVPIPVWSTKSFSSDWSASLDKEKPLVMSNLTHPPAEPANVVGTFTLNLPLPEIKDYYYIYAGRAYKRDNPIRPGEPFDVLINKQYEVEQWLGRFKSDSSIWTQEAPAAPTSVRTSPNFNPQPQSSVRGTMADVLFHEATLADQVAPQNSTLRRLDQSWRLSDRNRDEVIVVARLNMARGPSESVLTAANSSSPTQIWLKELPGDGKTRTPASGTLQQDTYIRIYVPIKR